ncbi:MAG TPA: nucleotide sugar dehydrogenase [Candidatus Paceibacterota bacterium]
MTRETLTEKAPSGLAHETIAHSTTAVGSVAVVGLGYVGLPLAILAGERGFWVRGFDVDTRKLESLRARRAPFLSKEETAQFKKSRMHIGDNDALLVDADIYLICVPTPVNENHEPDLGPLIEASKRIGPYVRKGALVIIESTVDPGACERVALPIIERDSGLTAEKDFLFAHCPERINPGDSVWDVRTIPRVVGGSGEKSLNAAVAFYQSILDAPIKPMGSIREAEAVKMVENAFRDVNIAFVNELAMSFAKGGLDIVNVIEGASTKPFAFMPHFPGCGVGGHCIPVDPYYLIRYGHENGFEHRFLAMAREINNGMPHYTVDLLEQELEERGAELNGATVALLGLAYKRDVPDLRESPALTIRSALEMRGAIIRTFDPFVPGESTHTSLESVFDGADAAIIATDHSLFRTLAPEQFQRYGISVVIDGRNCLDKLAFAESPVTYRGIGH